MTQVVSVSLKEENLAFVDNFQPKKSRSSLLNEAIELLRKEQLRTEMEAYFLHDLLPEDQIWMGGSLEEWDEKIK